MDLTEDLSARVLLKNILSTETPRTPIIRSASKASVRTSETRQLSESRLSKRDPGAQTPQDVLRRSSRLSKRDAGAQTPQDVLRRSSRLSKRDAGAQTPQDILRRSLKHKMRESITRKSLPATTRRTPSPRKMKHPPAPTSMLFDDADTPRHILRNIMLTEPVKSPVIHEKAASEEPQLPSADTSVTSKRPSIELSGLDLPDLTLVNAPSTAKGLSRKRPHRSLNVTAFEKRLKGASDVGEESEVSVSDHSSLSLSSSTSLSLKTPFVDVRTERRGLQRRVAGRRQITAEDFGAGVNKWQMRDTDDQPEDRNMTSYSEGFNLGLSILSEPDISTDIVHCNTALYPEPHATTSSDATEQGVAAEPLSEEPVSEGQSEKEVDTAEEVETKSTSDGQRSEEEDNRVEAQTEEEGAAEQSAASRSHSEEEEVPPDSQTEGEDAVDSQPEEEVAATSQSEEAEVATDSQTGEEEDAVDSQPEEEVAATSQSEEAEVPPDSQTREEEDGVDSPPEEDVAATSQSEEEEVPPDSQTREEEDAVDSQPEEEVAATSQSEEAAGDTEEIQSELEDPAANSQSDEDESVVEDEHDGKQEERGDEEQASELLEHVSRRAQRSQSGLIARVSGAGGDLPDATEEGWSEGKAHSAIERRESSRHLSERPDLAESSTQGETDDSDAGKENSLLPPGLTNDIEDGDHLSDSSSEEEAAALDPAEQEEEWEDEDGAENDVSDCETPAFVREKRTFFHLEPLASSSALKNIQTSSTSGTGEALPAAKPKPVQQRKRAPARKNKTLPKSYLMSVFRHFAKAKVSADVYPVLDEIMDKFFERLADDLETFAGHAKRKTIEVEDAVLLLKRQGHVNDKVPVEVLIEKYLRMDQRKLLIPIATSGNVVIPQKPI